MVRFGHQGVISWSLVIFHADVGDQGSTTLRVHIILQQFDIATLTTRPRYRGSSVLTALCVLGCPVLSLTYTRGSGQNTLGRGTLQIQVHVGTNVEAGRRRGTRWSWTRFLVEQGEGEQPPFLLTPSRTNVGNPVDLGTTHVHAIARLVRCILHCTYSSW
jgi:hypothetical protein